MTVLSEDDDDGQWSCRDGKRAVPCALCKRSHSHPPSPGAPGQRRPASNIATFQASGPARSPASHSGAFPPLTPCPCPRVGSWASTLNSVRLLLLAQPPPCAASEKVLLVFGMSRLGPP